MFHMMKLGPLKHMANPILLKLVTAMGAQLKSTLYTKEAAVIYRSKFWSACDELKLWGVKPMYMGTL